MKVTAIIRTQMRELLNANMIPKHILLTPRAIEVLILETNQDLQGAADPLEVLDRTRADGSIFYNNLEVIPAPFLARWTPVCVVATLQDEMRTYRLKPAQGGTVAPAPPEG